MIYTDEKVFIDTNILVYANDKSETNKQNISKEIIYNGMQNENLVISTQVLSEFYVTVTKKIEQKLSTETAFREITLFRNFKIIEIDYDSVIKAIELSNKYMLSYWDGLIISTALKAKCSLLFSEDLNHNQKVESILIKNPYIM